MTDETDGRAEAPLLRVLTLDGGGAKGFYTLGVLKEIEAMVGCPLHQRFDLVFGTSTGAIIASLIALGHGVDAILELYRKHVPAVMSHKTAPTRSAALKTLASEVFGDATFADVKTGIGVVTAKWLTERPMIFKGSVAQAHSRIGTFVPGFGVSIADAVKASCSAYPFFERTTVRTSMGEDTRALLDAVGRLAAGSRPREYLGALDEACLAFEHLPAAARASGLGGGTRSAQRRARQRRCLHLLGPIGHHLDGLVSLDELGTGGGGGECQRAQRKEMTNGFHVALLEVRNLRSWTSRSSTGSH